MKNLKIEAGKTFRFLFRIWWNVTTTTWTSRPRSVRSRTRRGCTATTTRLCIRTEPPDLRWSDRSRSSTRSRTEDRNRPTDWRGRERPQRRRRRLRWTGSNFFIRSRRTQEKCRHRVRITIIGITSTKRKEQNFNRNDKTELKAKKIIDSKNQFFYILNFHDFFFLGSL